LDRWHVERFLPLPAHARAGRSHRSPIAPARATLRGRVRTRSYRRPVTAARPHPASRSRLHRCQVTVRHEL